MTTDKFQSENNDLSLQLNWGKKKIMTNKCQQWTSWNRTSWSSLWNGGEIYQFLISVPTLCSSLHVCSVIFKFLKNTKLKIFTFIDKMLLMIYNELLKWWVFTYKKFVAIHLPGSKLVHFAQTSFWTLSIWRELHLIVKSFFFTPPRRLISF